MCSHDFFPVQHDHERLVVEFRGSSMKSGVPNLNFSFEKFKSQTKTVQFQAVFLKETVHSWPILFEGSKRI